MTVEPRSETEVRRAPFDSRGRALTYAAIVFAIFVTTVIVLAVKAGTSVAMLTTIFAIVLAATACGLWGTAMAVRDTHHAATPYGGHESAVTEALGAPASRDPRARR
jgi:hypothetical protein